MSIICRLRATVGAVPRARVRRQARQFLATTVDCRATQHRVLNELLRLNAGSRFSSVHRLDEVRTPADFRRRVPVSDYEYFRAYIEHLKLGRPEALLGPKNRLLMFALSSGTTSQSKYIPITERFLNDYRRGWQVWGINALDDHPHLNASRILQLSSDYDRFRTPGDVPCGNISGLVAAMQKRIVRHMYTVPGLISKIADPQAKNYTTLRLALADPEVGLVMTANPSTLIHLAQVGNDEKERLIRDIADGTLSTGVPAGIREQLGRRISRRNSARARQLEQIVERTGRLDPKDHWPKLGLVAVWTGGSAGAYLRTLRRYYGDVPVRDHGLSASEGRMTIPFANNAPAGVLDVATHYFEFIPEDEYGSDNPDVLEAHELQEGRNYYILLTTSSGLYRYDICDVVRCVGFHHTTPMLEFLHKGAHIANLTGEKLAESQVVTAVRTSLDGLRLHVGHFTMCPAWGDPPNYQLITEGDDIESDVEGQRLAQEVDLQLQQINCEYREKRGTGRLAPVQWLPAPSGVFRRLAANAQQRLGGSFEQYKHPCLVPKLNFSLKLMQDFEADSLVMQRAAGHMPRRSGTAKHAS